MFDIRQELTGHLDGLRAFALHLTRDRDRAEDLVQDTAVRALAKAHLFEPGTNFRAWVFSILHNQHIDSIRSANRRQTVHMPDDADSLHISQPPNQDDYMHLLETLTAMRSFPDAQRDVLRMVVFNGMSYEKAAEAFDCPVGTVRSRLARARRDLNAAMGGMN